MLNEVLEGWRDIDSAPRDGTVIQARIPGNGSDNMIVWVDGLLDSDGIECGGWAFANEEQEPPQCWTDGICWEVNEDGEQSVKPTYWKPSNDRTQATAAAPVMPDETGTRHAAAGRLE